MSGANVECSPQIIGCTIEYNVVENGNTPQINLGTSGADSIRIMNCEIIGNPENEMAGGIAVTTLFGGSAKARIETNVIRDNRYGITCYGNNIGSLIRGNEIRDNNTQNQPMLGGSGINFFGDGTNQSIVSGNTITGNLWGITIQNSAQPNFGQLEGDIYNPGANTFMDNGNEGEIYDLYNNTPNTIMAQNNYWGTDDPAEVEDHIFHQPDDPSLGLVDYLPLYSPPVNIPEQGFSKHAGLFSVSPNPATDFINIDFIADIDGKVFIEVLDMTGKVLDFTTIDNPRKTIHLNLQPQLHGVVFVKISANGYTETHKVLVH
jgi:parallel beta-helix repeat protein